MKKLVILIFAMMLSLFSITSCVTTVEAQDEVYASVVISADDIEMAITYGTPYVLNGSVLYYIYNNLYYYPFYTGGYYYYRVYSRPLVRYPSYWRPLPRNHWFRDGRYHNRFVRHKPDRPHNNIRQHTNIRQHNDIRRNNDIRGRINNQPRPRATQPNRGGHFGGRR